MLTMNGTNNNIADSDYARKRREIFSLVKELRALGAENEIQIPRIAVIGGQSAGKSSLVEAVTGISVPRDSGTCTRCPMECTIVTPSEQSSWSCSVSLRRSGQPNEAFSPMLTSKNDVDIWLRRAQTAILSPHASPRTFQDMSYKQLKDLTSDSRTLKFSRDVVAVDIEDPEGTDLSFIDLPGLVQNEDDDMIALVRGLVEHYINDPATIIIVTIPASDDMENQQAMRLAKAADPEGLRTIGVVTKPDSLTSGASGAREKWLNILQKKSHKLKLGYYVVRLPDDDERAVNPSRRDLEQLATKFFQGNVPWSSLLNSGRLGIPNFIDNISRVLMRIIKEALPKLKEDVHAKLQEVIQRINALPEEVTVDATTEILNRISKFCTDLQGEVYGLNDDKKFVHDSREIYHAFKVAIQCTAPNFRPLENPLEYAALLPPRVEVEEAIADFRDDVQLGAPIGLLEVRQVMKDSTGWELPHNIPYEAKKRLIKRFIDQWSTPAQECYDAIISILSNTLDEKTEKHFGQFPALEKRLSVDIRSELVDYAEHGQQCLIDALECEKATYFMQNNHYFEASYRLWLSHYRDLHLHPYRYIPKSPVSSPGIISVGASVAPTPPIPQIDAEIMVMADVRAYFKVAYKRVIDNIPNTIQRHLNQKMADNLQNRLVAKLGLGGSDSSQRLADLLAEDPTTKNLRVQLQTKKKRLEEIRVRLNNFTF